MALNVKFKKLHPDATHPVSAYPSDAGYDVVAVEDGVVSQDRRYIEYQTGLAIELPTGYHAVLHPRSSVSKYDLVLCNGIGLIDNQFRGEIKFRFKIMPINAPLCLYKKGDKIGQIKLEQTIMASFEEVDELGKTTRGAGGFGSSGS